MKLSGQKILVTGGSSGIGLEFARALLQSGNRVAICGRDENKLAQAREELGNIETIPCDLADPKQATALAEKARERLGGLSILINNAGVQFNYSLADTPLNQACRDAATEIQVNLTALIALTAACIPILREEEAAAVVNVSSALAITPKASAPVYCATKAAVHNFSQSLRYQFEDSLPHIKVFEVMPPLVDTAMTAGRGEGKISPQAAAAETLQGIEKDRYEIHVGKAKLLYRIHRILPSLAAKILRNS